MWLFGYGSLMWKVDFPFEEKIIGHVKGYIRRFYQHSIDHRGTPSNPGRVVTLLPSTDDQAKVYGVAYKIDENNQEKVIQHLDKREQHGYRRIEVQFYPKSNEEEPFPITAYVADENNPHYAGPTDIDNIVADVMKSSGPSGTNIEYVKNLAKSMRHMIPEAEDDHLFSIETKINSVMDIDERGRTDALR